MGLIEEFIARYRREYDYYDLAARLVAQALDSNLQAAGIHSMVTSRAKSPARLEEKVGQRAKKTSYATTDGFTRISLTSREHGSSNLKRQRSSDRYGSYLSLGTVKSACDISKGGSMAWRLRFRAGWVVAGLGIVHPRR
jgi:hypothetical protein